MFKFRSNLKTCMKLIANSNEIPKNKLLTCTHQPIFDGKCGLSPLNWGFRLQSRIDIDTKCKQIKVQVGLKHVNQLSFKKLVYEKTFFGLFCISIFKAYSVSFWCVHTIGIGTALMLIFQAFIHKFQTTST